MNQNVRFSIKQPCAANWEGMSNNEKGRFCSLCQKTVVDFTSMSDEEVCRYLTGSAGKSTCGRFYNFQINNNYNSMQKGIMRMYFKAESQIKNRLLRIAAMFAIGIAMTITGCNEKNNTTIAIPPKEDSSHVDSAHSKMLMGDTIITPEKGKNEAEVNKSANEEKLKRIKGKLKLEEGEVLKQMEIKKSKKGLQD